MSERLLISFERNVNKEDRQLMDAIFTENGTLATLLKWIGYDYNGYSGPLSVRVRDPELYVLFSLEFTGLAKLTHYKSCKDIARLRYDGKEYNFPTEEEMTQVFGKHLTPEACKKVSVERYLLEKWVDHETS